MKKIISEKNPELVTRKDNKAQWNLPNKRRLGFRNLYKITKLDSNYHNLLHYFYKNIFEFYIFILFDHKLNELN